MKRSKLLRKTRIRFQDCDVVGHLYNSRFIDYLLNAREEQLLEEHSFNLYEHTRQTGKAWVVGEHQISYLKPATILEEVTVESYIFDFQKRSCRAELIMYDGNRSHLKCIMWTKFVYFDMVKRASIEHGQDVIDQFQFNYHPFESDMRFNERVTQLRSAFRLK